MSVHVHGQNSETSRSCTVCQWLIIIVDRAPFDGWAADYAGPGQYKVRTILVTLHLTTDLPRITITPMSRMRGPPGFMTTPSSQLASTLTEAKKAPTLSPILKSKA